MFGQQQTPLYDALEQALDRGARVFAQRVGELASQGDVAGLTTAARVALERRSSEGLALVLAAFAHYVPEALELVVYDFPERGMVAGIGVEELPLVLGRRRMVVELERPFSVRFEWRESQYTRAMEALVMLARVVHGESVDLSRVDWSTPPENPLDAADLLASYGYALPESGVVRATLLALASGVRWPSGSVRELAAGALFAILLAQLGIWLRRRG